MSNLSVSKVYQLGLMTVAYIVGELTHFLINTTSKAQVRESERILLIAIEPQHCISSGAGDWVRREVLLHQ